MTSTKDCYLKNLVFILFLTLLFSCKQEKKISLPKVSRVEPIKMVHAKGFSLDLSESGVTYIKITSPWQNAETAFTYALVPKEIAAFTSLNKDDYDAIISVPVERIVVTSTTHIPVLEALGVEGSLVGFPNTDLISSEKTRKRIADGSVKELGNNEAINTELTISLQPDLVVGFGVNNQNRAYETIKKSNISVVYNGEWTEETPLGKAEWIKFFAPFFHKEAMADSIFKEIETSYNKTKLLTEKVKTKPTVLTGGLYKDVWHVAGGNSWMARFLKDAKTDYLWAGTENTGSIPLSIESVLAKGQKAEFWLNPSMLTNYTEMEHANGHYLQFDAFKQKNVYSNTIAKGVTGGLLYYELAPNRPDLVLKDLIHIFHPELLPDHVLLFFKPLP